jgi:hypothetical protein
MSLKKTARGISANDSAKALRVVGQVVTSLVDFEVKRATKYLSEKLVVSAQRRTFKNKIDKFDNIDIVLKIGKPNYAERDFIEDCKAAKEPFPVKGIILKHFPEKKKGRK